MTGFEPPPYPYDRLVELRELAESISGGCVDFSVGTPCDPPPESALRAMAGSGAERGYPPSVGTPELREAAADWLARRFGAQVHTDSIAVCIGTKELVAGIPHLLGLRDPQRDAVLYPAISYPTYAMGAILAGARPVAVPVDDGFRIDVGAIDSADAERALCLWVNTPGNPAGALDDLDAVTEWGRSHGVPVFSDECYADFTWQGPPRSILEHGTSGVVAVHSLSKRSNFAGARVGFYAGDAELVHYLAEVRKHAGFMVPGPVQAAAVVAYGDDAHVDAQRERYRHRLERIREILVGIGLEVQMPDGGFYLWVPAPAGDAWALTRRLATDAGALVSPGEFYGPRGAGHVRVAAVQPEDRIELVARRLGVG